jgi:hypothetical protein
MTATRFIRSLTSPDQERSPEYDRRALSPMLMTLVALSGCASTIVSLAAMG